MQELNLSEVTAEENVTSSFQKLRLLHWWSCLLCKGSPPQGQLTIIKQSLVSHFPHCSQNNFEISCCSLLILTLLAPAMGFVVQSPIVPCPWNQVGCPLQTAGQELQLSCAVKKVLQQNKLFILKTPTYSMINAETKTLLFVLAVLGHSAGFGYYILTIYENKVAVSSGYFQKQVSL